MLKIESKYKFLQPFFEYIFTVFCSIYEIPEDLIVHYGDKCEGNIHIQASDAISFFQNKEPVPNHRTWINWNKIKIPVMFNAGSEDRIIDKKDNRLIINYDILASAFYFLSCWQEHYSQTTDQYGRFPARESMLMQLGVLEIPVVNYYFDILNTAICYCCWGS